MLITLLTDFGVEDSYVAQMKGQILSICPQARLVDITHAVPPQDILAGAFHLAQAVPYFPADTIHLCVVDPGVGTERQLLAAEILTQAESNSPACKQRLVLPDNGLMSLLLARHSLVAANYVTNKVFWRPGPSFTFHGRDVMGPVAARWALGVNRSEFGPTCSAPMTLELPGFDLDGNSLSVRVISLDHFGNVITSLPHVQVVNYLNSAQPIRVQIDDRPAIEVPLVNTYGQCRPGEVVLLVGSHGYLELAQVGGNAAQRLGITRQSRLQLSLR